MKRIFAAMFAALLFSSIALGQERAGDAALGALSGAVILGPVGAVAGGIVGYTAGPSIARSWRVRHYQRRSSKRPTKAVSGTPMQRSAVDGASAEISAPSAKPSTQSAGPDAMPAVQTLE
jgi:hypothetical protein